jgi:Phage QLRG family, putative DNA packaging.
MRLKKLSEVSDEVVDVEDVKADLILTGDQDNDLIANYITTARKYVENYTKTSILQQQFQVSFTPSDIQTTAEMTSMVYYNFAYNEESYYNYVYNTALPDRFILPRPPVVSVDSAKWVDEQGQVTNYVSSLVETPGDYRLFNDILILVDPMESDTIGYYVIEYTTGYTTADEVPPEMLTAIRLMTAEHYENREGIFIPAGFRELLAPYRRGRLL